MAIASHPCNVVSLMVEVSDITDGASGPLGGKIPCPPTQKQAKQGGDEDPLEGVTLHPVSKTLALVQKPVVFWVPEFGKPVCYSCG
jgi:hypothetical protein